MSSLAMSIARVEDPIQAARLRARSGAFVPLHTLLTGHRVPVAVVLPGLTRRSRSGSWSWSRSGSRSVVY